MNERVLGVRVECYAGYRGEEMPLRFSLADRRLEIGEVLDSWLAPDHRYFKVRTPEGVCILRHDVVTGDWELTLFEREPEDC